MKRILRPLRLGIWLAVGVAAVVAAALIFTEVSRQRLVHTLRGVVLAANTDPAKQVAIPHARIVAVSRTGEVRAESDDLGYFHIALPKGLWIGESVELTFEHSGYETLQVHRRIFHQDWVARLASAPSKAAAEAQAPAVTLSDVRVRYLTKGATITAIGSMVRTFQVSNEGGVPCDGYSVCSPDGKWRGTMNGVTVDAGEGQEFRNARVSCIAGPCPFARIETDHFSRGGRVIGVAVRNWSDTVTFLLEAEVVRTSANDLVQQAYPAIFGRVISFTLPPRAQGLSFEADWNGQEITFPLGPALLLSWANCTLKVEPDQTRLYRCELKPGFRVKGS
ncbi:MAG TPA: carboxypeptidase regulatory-like domain-containing protein [Bryobacteraceae bacterium]